MKRLRVGVLALQGAFAEHRCVLEDLGAEAVEVLACLSGASCRMARLPEGSTRGHDVSPGAAIGKRGGAAAREGSQSGAVAARQGRLLAVAFHPELAADRRLHRYFLDIARS